MSFLSEAGEFAGDAAAGVLVVLSAVWTGKCGGGAAEGGKGGAAGSGSEAGAESAGGGGVGGDEDAADLGWGAGQEGILGVVAGVGAAASAGKIMQRKAGAIVLECRPLPM